MKLVRMGIPAALILMATAFEALARSPYIQNLKSDSVVILWRTGDPAESAVRIRRQGEDGWTEYRCTIPVRAHEMRIPNLQPDTVYEYSVAGISEDPTLNAPAAFRTFPSGGAAEFQFVAYGDHRNNPDAHRSVVDAVLKMADSRGAPRFILDTGDYTGDGEHKTDFWDEQFFGPERPLMAGVCLFPVIGNHEVPGRWPRIPFRYLENFAVPTENSGTEYYYSFDYGDAHFCMIDGWASQFERGSKQHAWIEQDLKRSKRRWKFAALHFPVYVHRSAPSVTHGNEAVREHLVPLFRKYGVTAVFSGDSHFYQRSEVDGIHYICTGGGGAPLYTPGSDEPYVKASKSAYHYTWTKIAGDTLTLWAFDTKNEVIDTFSCAAREADLPKPPPLNFVRRLPDSSMKASETLLVECRDAQGNLTPPPVYVERGSWISSTAKSAAPGLQGKGSRFSDNQEGDAVARIVPPIARRGLYLISITAPNASSVNAPNTLFALEPASPPGGKEGFPPTAPSAAQTPPSDRPVDPARGNGSVIRGRLSLTAETAGDSWHDIGLFDLTPGDAFVLFEAEDEPGRFYFDAVRFTRYEPK